MQLTDEQKHLFAEMISDSQQDIDEEAYVFRPIRADGWIAICKDEYKYPHPKAPVYLKEALNQINILDKAFDFGILLDMVMGKIINALYTWSDFRRHCFISVGVSTFNNKPYLCYHIWSMAEKVSRDSDFHILKVTPFKNSEIFIDRMERIQQGCKNCGFLSKNSDDVTTPLEETREVYKMKCDIGPISMTIGKNQISWDSLKHELQQSLNSNAIPRKMQLLIGVYRIAGEIPQWIAMLPRWIRNVVLCFKAFCSRYTDEVNHVSAPLRKIMRYAARMRNLKQREKENA